MKTTRLHTGSRAGMTIVEAAITFTMFAIVLGGFVTNLRQFTLATRTQEAEFELQTSTLGVLAEIRRDIERGGYVTLGGVEYPVLFPDGQCPLPAFVHAAPNVVVPGLGPSQEAVFVRPMDADGDNWPEIDANFDIVWDPDQIGYLLIPNPNGKNDLVCRTSAGVTRTLSRDVVQIVFEDPAATGFEIPLDSIRVTLTLSRRTPDGRDITRTDQMVVALLNGWLSS